MTSRWVPRRPSHCARSLGEEVIPGGSSGHGGPARWGPRPLLFAADRFSFSRRAGASRFMRSFCSSSARSSRSIRSWRARASACFIRSGLPGSVWPSAGAAQIARAPIRSIRLDATRNPWVRCENMVDLPEWPAVLICFGDIVTGAGGKYHPTRRIAAFLLIESLRPRFSSVQLFL